jgi:hypothetical protein
MTDRRSNLIGAGVGLALALCADATVTKTAPRRRKAIFTAALPGAAAVYPLARDRWSSESELVREVIALLAFGGLSAAVAAARAPATARALLATGWVAHAAFDMLHEGGDHSRVPAWYPAFCAGYDVGIAGCLMRDAE